MTGGAVGPGAGFEAEAKVRERNIRLQVGWGLVAAELGIKALMGMRLRTRKRDHPRARPIPERGGSTTSTESTRDTCSSGIGSEFRKRSGGSYRIVTQMLAPSKAIPSACPPAGKVPKTAPSLGRRTVTTTRQKIANSHAQMCRQFHCCQSHLTIPGVNWNRQPPFDCLDVKPKYISYWPLLSGSTPGVSDAQ